jgi:hypothetical protein
MPGVRTVSNVQPMIPMVSLAFMFWYKVELKSLIFALGKVDRLMHNTSITPEKMTVIQVSLCFPDNIHSQKRGSGSHSHQTLKILPLTNSVSRSVFDRRNRNLVFMAVLNSDYQLGGDAPQSNPHP